MKKFALVLDLVECHPYGRATTFWTENSANSATAKDGINAVRAFFEHHQCVFQEVAQQNDFGKDGYVDLSEGGVVTFLCAAVQIKSGISYRAASGDYFVPVETHAVNWRRSTVPVFGLVYDVVDGLIRWVDLTGYLRAHPEQRSGNVPVSCRHTLDAVTLHGAFKSALKVYAKAGAGGSHSICYHSADCRPMQFTTHGR